MAESGKKHPSHSPKAKEVLKDMARVEWKCVKSKSLMVAWDWTMLSRKREQSCWGVGTEKPSQAGVITRDSAYLEYFSPLVLLDLG